MRLMIDTNIILDVIYKRQPFFPCSKAVLELCEGKEILGFISASAASDLFYLMRKGLGNTEDTYRAFGKILEIVKVLTVTNDDVTEAYLQRATDFEDCLLATCSKSNNCEGLVTRNKNDFKNFGIAVYTPEEILDKLNVIDKLL